MNSRILVLALAIGSAGAARGQEIRQQLVLFNVDPASHAECLQQIRQRFPDRPDQRIRVGAAAIFSYLHQPRERTVADLERFLDAAEETNTPVLVALDGENWWGARPDLWNWWDPDRPGFSSDNRANVEWAGWSPKDAIRIAWRNWGRQIRVLPPPNLMSPRYREACHEEMRVLVPLILDWWHALPASKRALLVGIKLGWESSIGVNAWYYPNGNGLLDRPAGDDPTSGLKTEELPARGVAQIGYAAVATAGIRTEGTITESDLAEVVRRHLEDLCHLAADLGVPRERLFTHVAGWQENELLYQAGVNRFSCPGWSFYRHAADPAEDRGVRTALAHSDAPCWAAVEWLFQGPPHLEPWRRALDATLARPRCRFLCIYNWRNVRDEPDVLEAVQRITEESRGDAALPTGAGAGAATTARTRSAK